MTNVGYIDCLVNLYLRSKEYEVRWDLGEDLMMVNFDMSDSVYYEEGVNSVRVTLSFSKKYVYTIVETLFYVDAKLFKEHKIEFKLNDELKMASLIVNTNREGLKEIYFRVNYDYVGFELEDYTGIKVDFGYYSLKVVNHVTKFLEVINKFEEDSVTMMVMCNSSNINIIKDLCVNKHIAQIKLYITGMDFKNYTDYFESYVNLHSQLKGYGFYNHKNSLFLKERDYMNLLMISDSVRIRREGLSLINEMQDGVDILGFNGN